MFVGGSRGVYIIRPRDIAFFDSYVQFLFATCSAWPCCRCASRPVERSRLGRRARGDPRDELAAECSGVPT